MSYYRSCTAWLLLAAGAWHCTAATAGVAEGIAAIDKGHYRAALQELRPVKEPAIALESVPANPPMAEGAGAKGTLIYKSRAGTFTANLKYAWFVKGPDAVDTRKTVRHVILSATDIGPALQSCKTMMCADGHLTEGMTVDFDAGPRLNYWVSLNGQKVQYSGTVTPGAFAARVNDTRHLAGRLAIDDAAAGGAKVDVEFNGRLFKEFKPER